MKDRLEISINHLVTLSLVAQHKSFTRAAEALGVSQPSVSQQIRELERAVEAPVVAQQGRSIALTPLGIDLAEIGRRVSLERDRARRAVALHREGEAGRLTIAASMTTSTYVLPPIIAGLQREHPDTLIELKVGNTHDVAQLVSDDLADLGVVEGAVDRAELVVVPFARDEIICISAPRKRGSGVLEPAEVESETVLVREDGSGTREVAFHALAAHGFRFHRVRPFGTNETIKAGVRQGLGIAWLSRAAVTADLAAGALVELRFSTPPIQREFRYIRRRDTSLTPLGQAFVAALESSNGAS
ncbi:MAG TPA: LysR substrate-binding domain-containing protein [Candidatus Baltobacteraceae bacterium]|nr:LysR substrate-binding domain-containing protein [Candidatus Baltobacteraceae bacterium]